MTRGRTPLRAWHKRAGITWEELAERCDLGIATVMRAASGHPMGATAASALARETGIDERVFLHPKDPDEWGSSAPTPAPPAPPPNPEAEPDPTPVGGASPHYGPTVRGRILAEAEYGTDVSAAARYSISTTTLRTWRRAMHEDPECLREYRRTMGRLGDSFIVDAARAFAALANRLTELAPTMAPDEATHAIERVGDVLIQARGLAGTLDPGDDRSGFAQIDRQGAADSADPSSLGSGATH